jgi:hypothetical protein
MSLRLWAFASGVAATLLAGLAWAHYLDPPEAEPPTFGSTVVLPFGLRGLVYDLPASTSQLPSFSRMKPVGTIYTNALNVPPQSFLLGFPGVSHRTEWFGIDYTGRFWIDNPGEYRFALTSDDGAEVSIDERRLISLDGIHEPMTKSGRIALDCGIHYLHVAYFQGPRNTVALQLFVSGGGRRWRIFNTNEFKPPPNPEAWTCGDPKIAVPFDPSRKRIADALEKDSTAFEMEAASALNAIPRPHSFEVRSRAFHFRRTTTEQQFAVSVAVQLSSLSATLDADRQGVARLHVSLLSVVKANDGRVVDRYVRDAPYEVPAAGLAAARSTDLVFSHTFDLPAGSYSVETALIDHEGQRASTSVVHLDADGHQAGLDLSSIVLVQQIVEAGGVNTSDPFVYQGGRVVPLLTSELSLKAKPHAYFTVYPDPSNPAKAAIRVQFFVAGRLLADQQAELPPADSSGVVRMTVAAAAQPGDCELKITAIQGSESVNESVRYRVSAE